MTYSMAEIEENVSFPSSVKPNFGHYTDLSTSFIRCVLLHPWSWCPFCIFLLSLCACLPHEDFIFFINIIEYFFSGFHHKHPPTFRTWTSCCLAKLVLIHRIRGKKIGLRINKKSPSSWKTHVKKAIRSNWIALWLQRQPRTCTVGD